MPSTLKRVLVVTSDVPFVTGGHLVIARSTVRALRECGHEADLVLTPQNRFGRQFSAYLANRFTDVGMDGLGRAIDHVISFRFPSFAVRHPRHVCWLNHRLREYYDLWPMLRDQLGIRGKLKEEIRRRILRIVDTHLLKRNVRKVFAQSGTIQARLQKWGSIPSEILYPPPPQRRYRTESYGNFILAVSRLQKLKRIDLLVDAFRFVDNTGLRAVIVGDGPERGALEARVREAGLEHRIDFPGELDDEGILDQYARCRAVFFCPYNEDYGLVTPEAFASRKAVVTTTDSGGPAELVRDGINGFVTAPNPKDIARRLDELAGDTALAERLGDRAAETVSGMTWEKAVSRLLLLPG